MSDAAALLEVQRLDNVLDQLRFKHEHLPEREALRELAADETALQSARAKTEAARDDLRRQEKNIEDDSKDVEAKRKGLEGKLYDGSITSPKDAAAMGDEIVGLKARQSGLEDQALELLVEIEPLDKQLVQAEVAQGQIDAKRTELESSRDVAITELDNKIETSIAGRAEAALAVDDDTLEHYGKLRITYGPDAIVQFDAGRGGGCPVVMSAVELDRWKHLPVNTIEPCADCGRMVIKLD